jgi:glycerol-3-phosphate acyltransferase PlsX
MFTAGHSGAAVLAAHTSFGMMAGVERPALAVMVPTRRGAAVLLDVGATVDCRPEHLVDFARLGAAYARVMLGTDRPRVGLLSIGEEAGKGNDLIRDAHERLQHGSLDYIGNLEARDLFTGRADVAVCDGFTGNVALKVGEGLVEAIGEMLREEGHAFDRLRQRLDASEYGAAPLLGVNGLVLVGHGRSSARAVESGITLAARLSRAALVGELARSIAQPV